MKKIVFILLLSINYCFAQYCIPSVTVSAGLGISNVTLNTLNNNSVAGIGYENYTALLPTDLIRGQNYIMQLSIVPASNTSPHSYSVWFDWDQSGDFAGAQEQASSGIITANVSYFNFNIGVPLTATLGNTRMRVSLTDNTLGTADTCSQNEGDIEDYIVNIVDPTNMNYLSAEAFNYTSECVSQGKKNQVVIGVKLIAGGNLNPISATSFSFNTLGSSNATGDIVNANLWYTGTYPTFASTNLIGSFNSPNGNFIINGVQQLSVGVNYFWLTYDIAPGATVGNVVDAEATSFTVAASAQIPSTIAPPGAISIGTGLISYVTKEANIWHFGEGAGVDFNCVPPVSIDNGKTTGNGLEGVSSISDKDGNLLFYTNGRNIWNRKHDLMPNGTGLSGQGSSTQAALIVPQPGNDSIYYVFTCSNLGFGSMNYSIVNIHLDNGLGDVVPAFKNILLINISSEHITAVHHCNNTDIWIIMHDRSGNNINSYLLTSAGLQAPVITNNIIPGLWGVGQFMAAPTGSYIAVAGAIGIWSMEFNKSDGTVCNPVQLDTNNGNGCYAASFSPDGSKLYATNGPFPFVDIYQFDMNAGSSAAIIASKNFVGQPQYSASQMQIGPNGNIYICKKSNSFISSISNPNSGTPVFTDNSLDLTPHNSEYGFPNFIQSWFLDPAYIEPNITAKFDAHHACKGDTIQFNDSSSYYSLCPIYSWDFDDPTSGLNNFSSLANPIHVYNLPGIYSVTLTIEDGCKTSSFIKQIAVGGSSVSITASDTTTFCQGDSISLISPSTQGNLWNTGANSTNIIVKQSGAYILTVTDSIGCIMRDTINIIVLNSSSSTITHPGNFCINESATQLQVAQTGGLWSGSGISSNGIFDPLSAGTGTHKIKYSFVGLCPSEDSISISVFPQPIANAGNNIKIYPGETTQLNAGSSTGNSINYNWSPSVTLSCVNCANPIANPVVTTKYCVTVTTLEGCVDSACIVVTIDSLCNSLFVPNVFSPNSDGQNDLECILGNCVESAHFIIYNRFGEIIFETNDYRTCWDGSYKGKEMDSDVFVYYLSAILHTGEKLSKAGTITLLR